MKKIILLMITISTILLFGCAKKDNLQGEAANNNNPVITDNKYQNKENNFSLTIPKGRTFKENIYGSVVMLFSPESSGDIINENIGITSKPLISGANLESLYNQNKDMITKTISGVNIISEKDLTINNLPAKSISYSFKSKIYTIEQEQYIVLNNKNYYLITYVSLEKTFNDYKNAVEEVIGSFKF